MSMEILACPLEKVGVLSGVKNGARYDYTFYVDSDGVFYVVNENVGAETNEITPPEEDVSDDSIISD